MGAHRIIGGIWQGSEPKFGGSLRRAGFDALVLAAEEFQPPSSSFPGVRVHHAPLDDHLNPLTSKEWATIIGAANFAVHQAKRGRKVLITCHAGINRSGIITALTVSLLYGCTGKKAVALIKERRPGALRNTSFVHHIESVMV